MDILRYKNHALMAALYLSLAMPIVFIAKSCTKSDTLGEYRKELRDAKWYRMETPDIKKAFKGEGLPRTKRFFDTYLDEVEAINGFVDVNLEEYKGKTLWLPDKNGDGKIAGNDVSGYPCTQ